MTSNICSLSEAFKYWKDHICNIEYQDIKCFKKKCHPPNSKLQESMKMDLEKRTKTKYNF